MVGGRLFVRHGWAEYRSGLGKGPTLNRTFCGWRQVREFAGRWYSSHQQAGKHFQNRAHVFGVAAKAMRQILVASRPQPGE